MKKIITYLFGALLLGTLLFSCNFPTSQQMGQGDEGFLVIASPKPSHYKPAVEVVINDNVKFVAKVDKSKKAEFKGQRYQMSSGMKDVKITYEGNLIYAKKFMLSAQETKIIYLP